MDGVGHNFDEGAQEVSGDAARGFFMQLNEGELGHPIDGDEAVEPALGGLDLGDVDLEVAERLGLELAFSWSSALELGQSGDVVPLQTAVQRRRCQVRDVGLKGIQAVIQRQEVCRRKATTTASSSAESAVDWACFGPVDRSWTELRLRHLATVLVLMP